MSQSSSKRQRIRYVLPLPQDSSAHRLGVNGLAFDPAQSIIYSGGRDGIVAAWDASWTADHDASGPLPGTDTPCLGRVQAHSHWINDMILVRGGQAVVTASSDTSVKIWRPTAADETLPVSLGSHNDYVKCITSPAPNSSWVASAGLDRHVMLWDLEGAGQQLRFPVSEEASEKGSLYALASTQSVIASGGPDSIVRLHDTRSGRRAARFIGHTDNIRSVLISETQDTIISCSSDRTIKVWSITAGRCLYNLAMHSDSVWSLFSDHPALSCFYSGDRTGVVAKTDCRGLSGGGIDQAVSFAVCQDDEGINRILAANGRIWTATASSDLKAWRDLDIIPGALSIDSTVVSKRESGARNRGLSVSINGSHGEATKIPLGCVLRMPNLLGGFTNSSKHRNRLSTYHSIAAKKGASATEADFGQFAPLRSSPECIIRGQDGIVRHVLLNDKRRVVTIDTGGEVLLWDILECRQLGSFGRRSLDDVVKEINTNDILLTWCSIDTNIGAVTCTLREKTVLDGEVYADELPQATERGFAEDHRINLGGWLLRYLFDDLVREERARDGDFRRRLHEESTISPAGFQIELPPSSLVVDEKYRDSMSGTTPKALHPLPNTPGAFAIGTATPFLTSSNAAQAGETTEASHNARATQDDGGQRPSQAVDYFSAKPVEEGTDTSSNASQKQPSTPTENSSDAGRNSSSKEPASTSFSQRFRNTFSTKKSNRANASPGQPKTPQMEGKVDGTDPHSATNGEVPRVEKRMADLVQEMRDEYVQKARVAGSEELESSLRPCLPEETLILQPSPRTTILIQEEETADSSLAVTDLFQGYQRDLGKNATLIEKVAPYWLAAFLFKNERPPREPIKTPFLLKAYDKSLPQVSQMEGEERLTANRTIRLRKALEYISERLAPIDDTEETARLRPDECLEIWCQDRRMPLNLTLAQLRAHVWKSGGDMVLHYKPTGRRKYHPTRAVDPHAARAAP